MWALTRQSTSLPRVGRALQKLPALGYQLLGVNSLDTTSILKLAAQRLAESKVAFSGTETIAPAPVEQGPPIDPVTGAPMDPAAMAAGAPPVDPATGQPLPMDPAMAGGAPPMDPAMMDPAMAGGMPPAAPMPPEGGGEDPVVKLLADIDGIKADLAQIKDVVGQLADALPGAVSAAQLMKAQEESPLSGDQAKKSIENEPASPESFDLPEGYAVADSDGGSAQVSKESLEFTNEPIAEIANQVAEIQDPVAHFNAAANAAARAFSRR